MRVEKYIEILERYYRVPVETRNSLMECRADVENELRGFEYDEVKKVIENYCLDVDPRFFPRLGYVVAKLNREKYDEKEVMEFVNAWNGFVFSGIVSVNAFSDVKEAVFDEVKDMVKECKDKVMRIMKRTKELIDCGKPPFLKIKDEYFQDVWLFAFCVFMKRRYHSDFLYSKCSITPKFFCSHVEELVDPYSDEYLNDNEKYCD